MLSLCTDVHYEKIQKRLFETWTPGNHINRNNVRNTYLKDTSEKMNEIHFRKEFLGYRVSTQFDSAIYQVTALGMVTWFGSSQNRGLQNYYHGHWGKCTSKN